MLRRLMLLAVLATCGRGAVSAEEGAFKPEWESLARHREPAWYADAKFGIYFHWGPYSVPAFGNEWYSRTMYRPGTRENKHQIEKYGPPEKFGYKDFIPMFKAERFDPDEWAELFERAGAKFAGPVAEHADGFSMWDSRLTKWNAAQMGPHRDVVGEMGRAVRKRGMKFVVTFHHQWLWAWYPTMQQGVDASDPQYAGLYGPPAPPTAFWPKNEPLPPDSFCATWEAKVKEVIDRYQPDLIYFDSRMSIIDEGRRKDFLAYYYNRAKDAGREVGVTYKNEDLARGTGILDLERGRMSAIGERPWQTDDSIDWVSWGYVENARYKPAKRLVDELVDIVSKNGCLLLSIGPRADGTIPEPIRQSLLGLGAWLKLNGEAIYGTRPWTTYGEGPTQVREGAFAEDKIADFTAADVRFTTRGPTLYAICCGWAGDGATVTIRSLAEGKGPVKISSVQLIGHEGGLEFTRDAEGLKVTMPGAKPCEHAAVLKVQ